jgi:hypothetical protein
MNVACVSWDKDQVLDWDAGRKFIRGLKEEACESFTKGELLKQLKNLKLAFDEEHRESAVLSFGHIKVMITGGMSWGESPSNLYNTISDLENVSGILDAVGFNREDFINYKDILMKVLGVMKESKQLPCLIHLDDKLDPMLETMLRSGPKPKRRR